jgi:hypothetical protein
MSKRQKNGRGLRNGEFSDHLSESERDAPENLTLYKKLRDDFYPNDARDFELAQERTQGP